MTSEKSHQQAYVWIWLPQEIKPVVAGLLQNDGDQLLFNYGKSYLERPNAIAIYDPELPLKQGSLPLLSTMNMPSCIRDASPDAWGRRVIINRKLGWKGNEKNTELDELTYLLESGSDRIGALDFQISASDYIPRQTGQAKLEELLEAADQVQQGVPLKPELDLALRHGTALGGARPKALIDTDNKKFIAKFSTSNDLFSMIKGEFIAMRLAQFAGLNVANVHMERAMGRDVLLVERFDRERQKDDWSRKAMVSALTILELDEMNARYASYEDLAEIIRHRFDDAIATLKELYGRVVFNILCGNTDDHARNHAAFWNGKNLTLTPAYDICPQSRTGQEASQSMAIVDSLNKSQLSLCLAAAPKFMLDQESATALIIHQIEIIRDRWHTICDEAGLNEIDRKFLWRRQFLNPFAFFDAPPEIAAMADTLKD